VRRRKNQHKKSCETVHLRAKRIVILYTFWGIYEPSATKFFITSALLSYKMKLSSLSVLLIQLKGKNRVFSDFLQLGGIKWNLIMGFLRTKIKNDNFGGSFLIISLKYPPTPQK